MNFRPELAQAVMAGRKTVTRRLVSDNPRSPWWRGKCSLEVGRDYAVCPGRGKHAIGRVRVLRVSREPLHLVLNHGEAHREGFPRHTGLSRGVERDQRRLGRHGACVACRVRGCGMTRIEPLLHQSDTAYLICPRCTHVLPILHTDENERCPWCEGAFVIVDDHDLPDGRLVA